MKGKVMPADEQQGTEALQELAAETKQTTARQQSEGNKAIGSVDIWNIQRKMRHATSFRRRSEFN